MKTYLYIGLAVAMLAAISYIGHSIYQAGKDSARAEQAETVKRKLNDATIADTDVTRCLADPACRLSDDGFKRK